MTATATQLGTVEKVIAGALDCLAQPPEARHPLSGECGPCREAAGRVATALASAPLTQTEHRVRWTRRANAGRQTITRKFGSDRGAFTFAAELRADGAEHVRVQSRLVGDWRDVAEGATS